MTTTEKLIPSLERKLEEIKWIKPILMSRLKEANLETVEDIMSITVKELVQKTEIAETTAQKIIESARKLLDDTQYGFNWSTTYTTEMKYRDRVARYSLSTGVNSLDDILGRGIELGTLIELFGQPGAGKTQLCHQLCVMVQLPYELGGLNGTAMFIDTQNTFREERILQIANKYATTLNPNDVLNNIRHVHSRTSDHLTTLIMEAKDFIRKEKAKLLVIDSIISYYVGELWNAQKKRELDHKLRRDLGLLGKLISCFPDLIIVFTNQVEYRPELFIGKPENPTKPYGDYIPAHASTLQLAIHKDTNKKHIINVINAPSLPDAEASFEITGKGVCDIGGGEEGLMNKKWISKWVNKLKKPPENQEEKDK